MTTNRTTPDGKQPVKESGHKKDQIGNLELKDQAAAVKGGARIKKGGDPEEGGE